MIVVDASVVVEVLLRTAAGRAIEGRLFDRRAELHAPHLLDVEVAQVLRRYCAYGDLTPGRGAEAVTDLADLPITRHEHALLLPLIWQLRQNLTAYDAAYVALQTVRRLAEAAGFRVVEMLGSWRAFTANLARPDQDPGNDVP